MRQNSPLLIRFRRLHRRLEQERLQLAVLGQFKRGKSTFINALLGDDVLPTGVIPLTAVATFIAWRREPLVVVRFKGEAPNEEFAVHTADEIRNILFASSPKRPIRAASRFRRPGMPCSAATGSANVMLGCTSVWRCRFETNIC